MSDNLRINDLPSDERPREKMLRHGPGALSGEELLAIFLRTGTKGASAIEIGRQLIRKYGSLSTLGSLDIAQLSKEHGLGLAKSCQLLAAFELGARAVRETIHTIPLSSPKEIYTHLAPIIGNLKTETLYVLTLDTRLHLKRMVEISRGTTNQTIANTRDILSPVIIDQADAFVIAHNHPSGQPLPSGADDRFTKALLDAAKLLDVNLVDHLIIGKPVNGARPYYSYREESDLIF
ncbi:MAG: RadC family protein [Verrucomicrobiaceae bacterium]